MKTDKVRQKELRKEASDLMALVASRLDESSGRDYSKLEGFSESIKKDLRTMVSCVYGKVYLATIEIPALKASVGDLEILPLLPKDSTGGYSSWALVLITPTPGIDEDGSTYAIFPSTRNSKRVWIWIQSEFCFLCLEEGCIPTVIASPDMAGPGSYPVIIKGTIAVLRAFLKRRKQEWIAQQPTLKHSNERKQWKAFTEAVAKEGALLGPSYEYNREPTGEQRIRSSGYTVAAHDRDPHQRTYRNPDGTVRKVVDVKGSKVHGGAAAAKNTSLIIVK